MLGRQGDDDNRELATLRLVDGDGVRQGYFVQFPEIINYFTLVELNQNLTFHRVDFHDLADVPVESILVIVVLSLNDFVADPEQPAELLHRWLVQPGRI